MINVCGGQEQRGVDITQQQHEIDVSQETMDDQVDVNKPNGALDTHKHYQHDAMHRMDVEFVKHNWMSRHNAININTANIVQGEHYC